MVRRLRRQKRIAEEQTSYLANPKPQLPPFASTPDEIQRAVERNSIKRGVFIIKNLVTLNFDRLLQIVEQVSNQYDKEEWYESADSLEIDVEALRTLDNASPTIPYPYYFCKPEILTSHPELILYYRNVAMVSQKVMNDMGLSSTRYEAGIIPPLEIAQDLTHHFNQIISALVKANPVTPRRHLEMAYANLGDSFGGSWRNEVGRLAYFEVLTPLALHLRDQGCLANIVYTLKGRIVQDDEEEQVSAGQTYELRITESVNLDSELARLEGQRLVYRELHLHNGNRLLLNRQIVWNDADGKDYRIGPDMLALRDPEAVL